MVVDDVVTLTATDVEGIVGSGGYQWLIDPPFAAPVPKTGPTVNHTVSPDGTWEFTLTVHYDHGANGVTDAGGGVRYGDLDDDLLYEYEITKTRAVGPIAADFFWSPPNPKHTQVITLDGSPSRPTVGLTYEWEVKERGGAVAYVCAESADDQCVMPAETLLPKTWYDITLTVRKDTDTSVKTSDPDLYVSDGNIQPKITWAPTSPEIGEDVVFSIVNDDGSPLDVKGASWDLDGGGCDGADSTPDCVSSLWVDCDSQSFKYNSSGSKTVSVSAEIGDDTYDPVDVTLTVQSSGSCGPTGPPPGGCEYTPSRSTVNFGPNGGTTSFSVTTTSSCSWVANALDSWIAILAPSGEVTGSGTVRISVGVNEGPQREGRVSVGSEIVRVVQEPPFRAANFTMSTPNPIIGETVTFFVDPILKVAELELRRSRLPWQRSHHRL